MATTFYTSKPLRRTWLNRLFASIYFSAILTLLYHHFNSLSTTPSTSVLLLTADLILAFMWCTTQSFRLFPIRRTEHIDQMLQYLDSKEYPKLDVFICTADPYKEPPISVVNTALSVMAYDYPAEKISVYVSDDGGSQVTLLAFMEAAKFAKEWLPFCKKNELVQRSPEAYFCSDHHLWCPGTQNMKGRVEAEDLEDELDDTSPIDMWKDDSFTGSEHPAVVHRLLETSKDHDVAKSCIRLQRKEKKCSAQFQSWCSKCPVMTDAPILLTLDCDMYSNDPITAKRALCYFLSHDMESNLGYVQFPQRYHGINKNDIYASQHMHLFRLHPLGMDGRQGPGYVGTGCFFRRKAFLGSPASEATTTCLSTPLLDSSKAQSVIDSSHDVANCTYENGSVWGSEWKTTTRAIGCNAKAGSQSSRAAFLGDVPITFNEVLNQNKRWAIGTLEVALSKYTPLSFGLRRIGLLMSLSYLYYGFWPLLSIPIVTYSILPQLTLLSNVPIFSRVTEPLFLLYCFLVVGAYGQDLIEFVLEGSTIQRWWSDQRCWIIKGVTCHPFAFIELTMKSLGMSVHGFSLTNKVIDEEQSKRYQQEIFEFGVDSGMFVSITVVALLNLAAFLYGAVIMMASGLRGEEASDYVAQLLIAGFLVMNYWYVYESIMIRTDRGRMPIKTTIVALGILYALYLIVSSLKTTVL